MQVLFHKHVWLYSEYMPTLHWWIGASSMSPYVMIVTWWTTSGIILHHRPNAYELFTYCSSLIYFSVATVTITTKPILLLLQSLLLLPYYFAADIKSFRCGWIDNSATNTWEYFLAPLCRINKFGLNTLPLKTVVIPYTYGLSMLTSGSLDRTGFPIEHLLKNRP